MTFHKRLHTHRTLWMLQTEAKEEVRICGTFAKPSDGLEPSTPSLPWRFRGVTRVHARSLATQFLLQIRLLQAVEMRREASRVSFLMCPFRVRALLLALTTDDLGQAAQPTWHLSRVSGPRR
jgi:hypothetical protein